MLLKHLNALPCYFRVPFYGLDYAIYSLRYKVPVVKRLDKET